jgi:hypothetical protein
MPTRYSCSCLSTENSWFLKRSVNLATACHSMALVHMEINKARPLEAWEGISPNEGVKTRRRSAKMEAASSESRSSGASGASHDKENYSVIAQPSLSKEGGGTALQLQNSGQGRKLKGGLHTTQPRNQPYVTPEWQSLPMEDVVTPTEKDASSIY